MPETTPPATMPPTTGAPSIPARLGPWAAAHYGPGAVVERVERMPGNAGISFGFDVVAVGARERLVIRVPPPGVRRQGNTDVLRQVPILQAAAAAGVPVAPVRWWGEDERWFGVPYLIVDRLPGRSGNRWNVAQGGAPMSPATFRQAVDALVAIHAIPWADTLDGWGRPRVLASEIRAWEAALSKADDPDWIRQGTELRDALLARRPPDPSPGVVHGDYYPNNWMFDDGRLTGVVDWEIAALGPSLLDLGWLCAFHDPHCWAPGQAPPPQWAVAPDDLGAMYEASWGRPVDDLGWYQALACWRFGAITALNVHLHRSGRRPDPFWEDTAASFPYLISRGRSLLAGSD